MFVACFGERLLAQHDMSRMSMVGVSSVSPIDVNARRLASGTSWLPDSSSVPMIGFTAGSWSLMLHGMAFGMFDRQWTLHGDSRWAELDWEMARAERALGHGRVRFTAMTSFESFFLPDTGYPELLQTGETFGSRRIANVQHRTI